MSTTRSHCVRQGALAMAIAGLLAGCAGLQPYQATPSSTAQNARAQGTKDNPNARADWFYGQRAYPLKEIPPLARAKALDQAAKIAEYRRAGKAGAGSLWTPVGPLGFDTTQTAWGRQSGRVRVIAPDPADSNRIYIGAATGGVWRSNDGGASWTALTDSQPSLAIGALAVARSNPQVIYAGTGEGNGGYYSVGLLKSTDGGASWTVLGSDTFRRSAFAGLAVDPTNPDIVVACVTNGNFGSRGQEQPPANAGTGVFRSTDGGATFTRTRANVCFDMAVVPDNFNIMFHTTGSDEGGNGVYRSTDGGQSWSLLDGAVNGADVRNLAVAVSKDGNRVYIGGDKGSDIVIQRSDDGGNSWQAPRLTPNSSAVSNVLGVAGTYCESQCFYDNEIAVNPFNADEVIFGGVGAYRSTDGAQSFTTIGDNNNPGMPPRNLHVDHHAVAYHPTVQGLVYNGNDGGVWKSTDGGANWSSINAMLGTLQPYHLSLHPTDPNILFTGNQDNGTLRRSNSDTWTEVFGGDGGFTAINPTNPSIVYASTTNLAIARSTDGGATFADLFKPEGDPVQFIAPYVLDPSNPLVIYGGTNRLYRSTDGMAFAAYTGPITTAEGSAISGIAVAPSDANIVYVVGSDGTVSKVTSGTPAAVNAAPLPGRFATHVAVHPTDPNTVYVTFSGFNDATPDTPGHVFKSTNGGMSWTNISDNLPDSPANSVALRPGTPDEVYVATDVGVYISTTGGGSWARMANGLPNAPVIFLAVNGATNTLAAATYGRSVWKTQLDGGSMPPAGTTNYSYTYFNASEAGWGYNVSHQGNIAFATWYTYAPDGLPMFLTVQGTQTTPGTFAGPVFRVAGTPFNLINGSQAFTSTTQLGTGEMVFDGNGGLQLSYNLDQAGITAMTTKQLTRFNFSATPPSCAGTTASRASATNYTDLWWNSSEAGWGLTVAHQGDVIFILWYTYGEGGRDQWVSGTPLQRQPDGSFSGPLQRPMSGTPIADINGQPATTFPVPAVGMATLRFSDGETGTFEYTLDGVTQTKNIQRFVAVAADQPKVICQ